MNEWVLFCLLSDNDVAQRVGETKFNVSKQFFLNENQRMNLAILINIASCSWAKSSSSVRVKF